MLLDFLDFVSGKEVVVGIVDPEQVVASRDPGQVDLGDFVFVDLLFAQQFSTQVK